MNVEADKDYEWAYIIIGLGLFGLLVAAIQGPSVHTTKEIGQGMCQFLMGCL